MNTNYCRHQKITGKTFFMKLSLFLLLSISITTSSFANEKQTADWIVYADYLVTMQAGQAVIQDGAVAVRGKDIIAVGTRQSIDKQFQASNQISGKDRILMPGLINGHTHSAMSLFRGLADDLELMTWLNKYIFPMENKFVNPDFIKTGAQLACWEMIQGGITTFVDMYFYPEVIAEETINCGLRAILGAPAIDYPSPGFKGWEDSHAAAVKFVTDWQGKHERITPAFAPHAPYTVAPEHITQVANAARKLKAPITTHLAESPHEMAMIKQQYQKTSIKHVADLGMFDQIQLIAAHVVYPDAEDMKTLANNTAGAIHNPTSNLKIASGISPVPDLLSNGVAVGLGTDGAASNNDLDLWEEIRLAALIHKVDKMDPTVVPAGQALDMATRLGAKAIGMDKTIGQLKPGLRADLIQIAYDDLRLQPMFNVVSHLVYVTDSQDVVTSMVSGQLLMRDREVLSINKYELQKDVKRQSKTLNEALNLAQ